MSACIKAVVVSLVVPMCHAFGPASGRPGPQMSRRQLVRTAFLAAGSALEVSPQPAAADCNCGTCEKAAQQVVDDLSYVLNQHPGLRQREDPTVPGSGSTAHLYGYCKNLVSYVEDTSPGKPSLVNWLGLDSEQGAQHPVVRSASRTIGWLSREGKRPLCAPYVPGLFQSVKRHGGCHLNPHSGQGVKQTWQSALQSPTYPVQKFGKWVDGLFGGGVYNEHKFYNQYFGYLPSLQIQDELLVLQLIRESADCESCKLGTAQKTQPKPAADINKALAELGAGDGAVSSTAPAGWPSERKLKFVRRAPPMPFLWTPF
jgi:hypothetical protein